MTHELHGRVARGEEARRAAGALLGAGGEEAIVEGVGLDELVEQLACLEEAGVVERVGDLGLLQHLRRARLQREVVPVVRGGPAVACADGDRRDAGGLERVDRVVQLVEGFGRPLDARLGEELSVVPEAGDAEVEGQPVGRTLELPRRDDAAESIDALAHVRADVLHEACLDLGGELAGAPLLVEVEAAARAQLVGNEGALQFFVLVGGDLDGHTGVGLLELGGDLLPEAEKRLAGTVVPPREGDIAAVAGAVAVSGGGARCEGTRCERGHGERRPPPRCSSVHL